MLDEEWIAEANCKTMTIDQFISKFVKNADEATAIFETLSLIELDKNKSWANNETERFANLFFDTYEDYPVVANIIDKNVCMTCPVIADCFNHGVRNEETGVWGGVYLTEGEISPSRNAHKTQDVWLDILSLVKE